MIIHPYTSQTVSSQKKPLSQVQGKIVDVSMANIEEEVLKASSFCPVLVDFWAPWCGPCQQFVPLLEGLQKKYSKPWVLAKVNVDEQSQLAAQFRIQSIPSVVVVIQGRPVDAFMGVIPEADLIKLLDKSYQFYKENLLEEGENPLEEAEKSFNVGDYVRCATLLGQCLSKDQPLSQRDGERLVLSYTFLGQREKAFGFLDALDKTDTLRVWLESWGEIPPDEFLDLELRRLPDPQAKQKLIELFSLLGSEHTLVQEGRKRMSRILFA